MPGDLKKKKKRKNKTGVHGLWILPSHSLIGRAMQSQIKVSIHVVFVKEVYVRCQKPV